MTRLGAILAGGMARRFGGDKAAAPIGGVAMIERVAAALGPQCDALVVVGRDWPGLRRIDDHPVAGLGPLGGLAGALLHAGNAGFDDVLTSGCDLPALPTTLTALLAPAPAVIAGQPLLGLWPAMLGPALRAFLDRSEDRSMRAWIGVADARLVTLDRAVSNINTKAELEAYERASYPHPRHDG